MSVSTRISSAGSQAGPAPAEALGLHLAAERARTGLFGEGSGSKGREEYASDMQSRMQSYLRDLKLRSVVDCSGSRKKKPRDATIQGRAPQQKHSS